MGRYRGSINLALMTCSCSSFCHCIGLLRSTGVAWVSSCPDFSQRSLSFKFYNILTVFTMSDPGVAFLPMAQYKQYDPGLSCHELVQVAWTNSLFKVDGSSQRNQKGDAVYKFRVT